MIRSRHPMPLRTRWRLRIALVSAFAWIGAMPAVAQSEPAESQEKAAVVSCAAVRAPDAVHAIKLPAELVPDEQVPLFAKTAGYLEEIAVDKGDRVTKGQVIARLSAPEMEPELALAEAKLRATQARIGKARATAELEASNHKRLSKLRNAEPGAVTEEDVETAAARDKTARADVASAEAELGVATAEVKRLETLLDYLVVRAPFDGTVTQRFADPGAFIAAGSGTKPIIELTRVSRLRLAFELPERLTPYVIAGTPIQFSVTALPGQQFTGNISRRTDVVAPDTRTMRAEADVDNAGGMFAPGMYASIQIPLSGMDGLSVVPVTALRTIDGKTSVFSVEQGAARRYPVEVLVDTTTEAVVSSMLKHDAKVIVQPPAALTDGQRVDIKQGE